MPTILLKYHIQIILTADPKLSQQFKSDSNPPLLSLSLSPLSLSLSLSFALSLSLCIQYMGSCLSSECVLIMNYHISSLIPLKMETVENVCDEKRLVNVVTEISFSNPWCF